MKKWKVLSANNKLDSEKDVIDELLRLRKITDSDFFLNPKLEDLSLKDSGILLKELGKSIERIKSALEKKEQIIILGDYDVDGICASAILWETIYGKYKNVFPYIPDRFTEGYGISAKTIDNILGKYPDTKLIITVDNGIVANNAINYANKKGLDIIITDHHLTGEKLPNSYSVVHTTKLCGAGVAWMLSRELGFESKEKNSEKLELVAMATIADLVPLTDLNRAVVKLGLEKIQNTKRLGLLELYKNAGIKKDSIGVYQIGHMVAPRLNATGRITHAIDSLRLLCSQDKEFVRKTALLLESTNRKRQQMVIESVQHASLSVVSQESLGKIIAVYHESYSEGVVGLIAAKLVERHYRPSIAISVGKEKSKGSARSIAGVNIVELLRSVSGTLAEVGGHPMAAGFSLETKNIEKFYKAVTARAEKIDEKLFEREVKVDMKLPLSLVSPALNKKIQTLSPFGMGNPEPVFVSYGLTVENVRKLGHDGSHLKIGLTKGEKTIEAIGFGMGETEIKVGDKIDAVYTFDENVWNGKSTLQLKLRDIRTFL